MNSLDLLCFDVLGDFVDPHDITVSFDRKQVTVKWPRSCPIGVAKMMESDWKRAVEGTEFQDVKLIVRLA